MKMIIYQLQSHSHILSSYDKWRDLKTIECSYIKTRAIFYDMHVISACVPFASMRHMPMNYSMSVHQIQYVEISLITHWNGLAITHVDACKIGFEPNESSDVN